MVILHPSSELPLKSPLVINGGGAADVVDSGTETVDVVGSGAVVVVGSSVDSSAVVVVVTSGVGVAVGSSVDSSIGVVGAGSVVVGSVVGCWVDSSSTGVGLTVTYSVTVGVSKIVLVTSAVTVASSVVDVIPMHPQAEVNCSGSTEEAKLRRQFNGGLLEQPLFLRLAFRGRLCAMVVGSVTGSVIVAVSVMALVTVTVGVTVTTTVNAVAVTIELVQNWLACTSELLKQFNSPS